MTPAPSEYGAGSNVFLTAEWRDLLLLKYEVEPELLRRHVPRGAELDSFQGKTYVSLVGFRFLGTRLRGKLAIPFHADFTEINLRFYVRRNVEGEMRRGVVFIAEIVPRLAIAKAARWFYGENYVSRHMKHSLEMSGQRKTRDYGWRNRGNRYGKELPKVFRKKPDSAFVAEGSAVSVYSGTKIA